MCRKLECQWCGELVGLRHPQQCFGRHPEWPVIVHPHHCRLVRQVGLWQVLPHQQIAEWVTSLFYTLLNTFCATQRGPRSSRLCSRRLWSKALILETLDLLSWKTQPKWNWLQNKLPSDEGRELYHFLLHCVDVQIGKNTMASQKKKKPQNKKSFSEGLDIDFSWMVTASIKLMTQTMVWCLVLNKLERRRVKLCQTQRVQC